MRPILCIAVPFPKQDSKTTVHYSRGMCTKHLYSSITAFSGFTCILFFFILVTKILSASPSCQWSNGYMFTGSVKISFLSTVGTNLSPLVCLHSQGSISLTNVVHLLLFYCPFIFTCVLAEIVGENIVSFVNLSPHYSRSFSLMIFVKINHLFLPFNPVIM